MDAQKFRLVVAEDTSRTREATHIISSAFGDDDEQVTERELAAEHTSEPIKDPIDIMRLSRYFVSRGEYRNNMMFILGINVGLRVSDLLSIRFSDIIREENGKYIFKESFDILEKKTRNTRKVRKNRRIVLNDSAIDAVSLFLEHSSGVSMDTYLFRSESNRGGNLNEPMHRNSVERIIKRACSDLGITAKVSTHTLRKTFAYHQLLMSGNDPRKLLLLQKMFGHSSVTQTLDYIGITNEEMEDAYKSLNLGLYECSDSALVMKAV